MATDAAKQTTREKRTGELIGLLLVAITLALYWPATHYQAIEIDDGEYVFANPHIQSGISWGLIKWALTTFYASNWHPLTWISHTIDYSIFGAFPGGHHLTNIVLHAVNTLLFFLVLKRMTGRLWPSTIVAALFGWHPEHVESVAWISERKDVLSTFFLLLTLLAYICYARESKVSGSKFKVYYGLALLFFALGLMSKSMLVTLPCLMLLLDFWPLRRICDLRFAIYGSEDAKQVPFRGVTLWRAVVEKIPFFGLAAGAALVTLLVQGTRGVVKTTAQVSFGLRVSNALEAYALYAGRMFWPAKMCIYYLLPAKAAVGPAIAIGVAMMAITWLVWRMRSRQPWLAVGWFWFLGLLVPVIGLVQVGSQAMADRYSYVPLVGLFITVVWSVDAAIGNSREARMAAGGVTAVALAACLVLTHLQLSYWQNNLSLFRHAALVTKDNYLAEYEWGAELAKAGQIEESFTHFETCLRINPSYELAHFRYGIGLASAGKLDAAAGQFTEALKRDPNSEELHNDLGMVLAQQDKPDAAAAQFVQALRINPKYAQAYFNLGKIMEGRGAESQALMNYERARQLDPTAPEVSDRMASLLATTTDAKLRNPTAAVKLAENANVLTQQRVPAFLATWATAYAANGDFSNAVTTAESALAGARELKLTNLTVKLEKEIGEWRGESTKLQ